MPIDACRYWLVPVSGFDDQIAVAESGSKAKAKLLSAGKDAGYFAGRSGSADFFARVGAPREIDIDQVRARIGGHRPIGAPEGWVG